MTRNTTRGSLSAFASVVIAAVVTDGRRGTRFLFEMLQDAYVTAAKCRYESRLAF
jgi:hypothetical protein